MANIFHRVKFYWLWYDAWVGLYYDQVKQRLYIGYFPTLGIRIDFGKTGKQNLE